MKKQVIFITQGLTRGGTEKTLIEALNAVDDHLFDVTLYIRKGNQLDLVECINKNVNVIVNSARHYNDSLYSKSIDILAKIINFFSKKRADKLLRLKRKRILNLRRKAEFKKHFKGSKKYDIAISYDMANDCAEFTLKYINAEKKITFLHTSHLSGNKSELFLKFDEIVAVNSSVAETIKKEHLDIQLKIDSLENYIDGVAILKNTKSVHPFRYDKTLKLAICGRFDPVKGFISALSAFEILKSKGIEFECLFIGDGQLREVIEKEIKNKNLENEIIITGFVPNPQDYINSCDIYLQPSVEDAHPTTMIEALALHKPMVSTETLGGTYIISKYKCGLLAKNTPSDIVEKIITLCNNPQLRNSIIESEKAVNWKERKEEYTQKLNSILQNI